MADFTSIPEEVTLLIFSRLPVKSLIRFASTSKRFRSIIISDQEFAKSQWQAARQRKTLAQRLVYNFTDATKLLETVDLESACSSSSIEKHELPSTGPDGLFFYPLGSCNGIVFLCFDDRVIYAWNPSTGFFKQLLDYGGSSILGKTNYHRIFYGYGVGYFPDTDDYKVILITNHPTGLVIYSSKAKACKQFEVDFPSRHSPLNQGLFVKEALHWLSKEIIVLDLNPEENRLKVREILLPMEICRSRETGRYLDGHIAVGAEGDLCLVVLDKYNDSIDIWVMREYGVSESLSKHFSFKFSHQPGYKWSYSRVFVLETCVVAELCLGLRRIHDDYEVRRYEFAKIGHKDEEETYVKHTTRGVWWPPIQYQESLLRIED